jgi:Tfp pilus assembly protein PilV
MRQASANRRGASLVEVIVGLVMLSICMVGVGGMLMQAALRATQTATQASRAAAQTANLSRLSALPYDSLPAAAGCKTITTASFPHIRCVAVTDSSGGSGFRQIRVIITPTNGKARPDTMYFVRSKGAAANPLGS